MIVPVGGGRFPMIVSDVPQGMKAMLFGPGSDAVLVYDQDGNLLLGPAQSAIKVEGGSPRTFWIEAVGMADIAFTLTLDVTTYYGMTYHDIGCTGGMYPLSDTVRVTAVLVDLDVDSNNDGSIDPENTAAGTDDPIEEWWPGRIIFVNSDDDSRNGVADVLDGGHLAGENDLVEIVIAAAPLFGSGIGSLIVTYDETIVRLYTRPDRSGGIVSGFSEPDDNPEEDRLERVTSTGKLVFATTGDVDRDGIVDAADFGGITGANFVPMAVRLSENVWEGSTSIQVYFDYDPSVFRLWKPGFDAGTVRTEHNIIPAGTWLSADALGLERGVDRTVYVEALKGDPPSPNLEPGLVRESSCPWWGWKGFSDEEATQCRADRGLASAG